MIRPAVNKKKTRSNKMFDTVQNQAELSVSEKNVQRSAFFFYVV